jgi:hypothetical protein
MYCTLQTRHRHPPDQCETSLTKARLALLVNDFYKATEINARRALVRRVSHYFLWLYKMIGDKPSHGASRIEVGTNARRATLRRISDLKMIGDVPYHGPSGICLLPSPTPRSAAPAFLARLSFCNLRRALRGLSQIACSYLLFWRSEARQNTAKEKCDLTTHSSHKLHSLSPLSISFLSGSLS